MSQHKPVLIIGGMGKTGKRVNKNLVEKGVETRPVSRSTTPAFDWNDTNTWQACLEGVKSVYVTYQPDLAVPGADIAIKRLCEMALANDVKQIVLLSGRGEDGAIRAENELKQSGLIWTIVRSSWFAQNFSEHDFKYGIAAGELALPVGNVPEPFIDIDDIADIVVAALTEPGHENKLYEVTGPRAITFTEAVDEISKGIEKPVKFTEISTEQFKVDMDQAQVPDEMTNLMIELFTEVLDGRNSETTNGVEQALGRPARDFSDYVKNTNVLGVWNP